MKIIKFLTLIFVLTVFKLNCAQASVSSIMVDAKSGAVLYARNADELRYPASLTKLMTLYITFNALENGTLKLDDRLKVSYTAAGRSPSRLGLQPGKTIDVRTAILGTIVKSANDCATVLGEALSGDERKFAALMTATAKKLGMKNTTFKNASGLPNSQQKTTARDMAILAAALYHHFPQYYSWFSISSFSYEGKTYTTHNYLLRDFDGADGMKTGYTAASGFNIVTSARRGTHRVIAVTMGHDRQEERDKTVYAMMDKGLEKMESERLIDIRSLQAEINLNLPSQQKTKLAVAKAHAPRQRAKAGAFAIQTGAFADRNKARMQAEAAKRKLAGNVSFPKIDIERFNRGGRVMYRSRLVGVSKAEAGLACRLLKSKGMSCLVTAYVPNRTYAQK